MFALTVTSKTEGSVTELLIYPLIWFSVSLSHAMAACPDNTSVVMYGDKLNEAGTMVDCSSNVGEFDGSRDGDSTLGEFVVTFADEGRRDSVGVKDGHAEGEGVGSKVPEGVGSGVVGMAVGLLVGCMVGLGVGLRVGAGVGGSVGFLVGASVGLRVVGGGVGRRVGASEVGDGSVGLRMG